jgi:hypothetical protein
MALSLEGVECRAKWSRSGPFAYGDRHATLFRLGCGSTAFPPGHKGEPMDRFIAKRNIEHYRKLLTTEQDETRRQQLLCLLAEEEGKLAALDKPPERKRKRG